MVQMLWMGDHWSWMMSMQSAAGGRGPGPGRVCVGRQSRGGAAARASAARRRLVCWCAQACWRPPAAPERRACAPARCGARREPRRCCRRRRTSVSVHVGVEHLRGEAHARRLAGVLLAKGDLQGEDAALRRRRQAPGPSRMQRRPAGAPGEAGCCTAGEPRGRAAGCGPPHLPGGVVRAEDGGSPDVEVVVADGARAAALRVRWRVEGGAAGALVA
jgi:hypothetical protein